MSFDSSITRFKVKRVFIPILLFVFTLLLTLVAIWWKENSSAVTNQPKEVSFTVPKGRTASQIAQSLYQEGLIKSPLAFKIYVQLSGNSEKIQAGRYTLSPSLTLVEILKALLAGPKDVWVTIPEGLRREEVVEKVIIGLKKEGEEAEEFRESFLSLTKDKEGYLFPDTYLFPRNANAFVVVSTMLNTFERRIDNLKEKLLDNKLSLNEVVILASIIERETKTKEERPVVAGILINRLNLGMGLQADATVQYAVANSKLKVQKLEKFWEPLTKEDLMIDSPYNTYKYKGLPPTAIANPGISSIEAVVFASKTDYLYYLHDREGNIHYARTFSEHNKNVARYLKK